jgi:glycerol-3-phosphate dehydrogenase
MKELPEGVHTVRACRVLARSLGLSLPIAETTCGILEGELDPRALEASLTGFTAFDIDGNPLQ